MAIENDDDDVGVVNVGGEDGEHATEDETRQLDEELGAGAPKPKVEDDDDDEGEDRVAKVDTELDDAANDTEREAIRARRRDERARRKNNRHEKLDSLERTVQSLTQQNRTMAEQLAQLGNSDMSSKLGHLDSAIDEAAQVYAQSQALHADAIAKSDGVAAARAMDTMFRARDRHASLTASKESMVRQAQAPRPLDPRVQTAAARFASKHSWYKGPGTDDADSQVLTMLDNQVTKAGFDPTTDEYWAELESRGKRYLGHRFSSSTPTNTNNGDPGYNEPTPRNKPRSPVAGAGQRVNTPNNEGEGAFKLSAARVSAMKEAGAWDDPVRRKKLIAEYQRIDKQGSSR